MKQNTPLRHVSNERRSFHASNGLYLAPLASAASGNRIEATSTVPVALHARVMVASAPGSLVSTFWCHLKTDNGRRVALNNAGDLIVLEAAGDVDADVFYWFQLLRSRTLSATLEQCSLRAHTGKFLSVKQKRCAEMESGGRSRRLSNLQTLLLT